MPLLESRQAAPRLVLACQLSAEPTTSPAVSPSQSGTPSQNILRCRTIYPRTLPPPTFAVGLVQVLHGCVKESRPRKQGEGEAHVLNSTPFFKLSLPPTAFLNDVCSRRFASGSKEGFGGAKDCLAPKVTLSLSADATTQPQPCCSDATDTPNHAASQVVQESRKTQFKIQVGNHLQLLSLGFRRTRLRGRPSLVVRAHCRDSPARSCACSSTLPPLSSQAVPPPSRPNLI